MPTIRRPGATPADAPVSAPPAPEGEAPREHALLPLRVPEDTTPTWELEMLVSGAVLVGLFQLPPLLARALAWLGAHMGAGPVRMLAQLALVFGRATVYVLIAAFIAHLASRAYWVALVGLDSVFPGGVRWERLTGHGPLGQTMLRRYTPDLPAIISRLDNFCSIVFAVGFLAAFFALLGVVLAAALLVVLWLAFGLLGGPLNPDAIMPAALVAALVMMLPRMLDRRFGGRLSPRGPAGRALHAALAAAHFVSGRRFFAPILLTLRTNLRRGVLSAVVVVLYGGSLALSMAQLTAGRGDLAPGAFPGLPAAVRAAGRDYLYYADQRSGLEAQRRVPFIQSDIVRDPYVRLFIPYDPARDRASVERCRRPAASVPADAQVAALLRCVAADHVVIVDGRARPDLDVRFYTDPSSGLSGLLAYIPVADLPKGRNVLTVSSPVDPDRAPHAPPERPVTIPFWL